jgi:hypothetical protein
VTFTLSLERPFVVPEAVPTESHDTPEDPQPAVGETGRFHQSGNAASFAIVRLVDAVEFGACVDDSDAGETEIAGAAWDESNGGQ